MGRRDEGPSGVLLLDKPAGITSTRALALAKRLLGSRKAGHTGTLDPFATGLLPLAFGDATRFSRFLLDARKGYLATLQLGRVTSTGDPEGEVIATSEVTCTDNQIARAVEGLIGIQAQTPPMHSALHYQGRRLYEWARDGVEVPRESREIEIFSLSIVSKVSDLLTISVNCSKGTYIRTLAMELGSRLGCGATLTALRRTQVGPFEIASALTQERLEQAGSKASSLLLAPQALLQGTPACHLDAELAGRVLQGRFVDVPEGRVAGEIALFGPQGRLLGVGRGDGTGRIDPVRLVAGPRDAESPDSA